MICLNHHISEFNCIYDCLKIITKHLSGKMLSSMLPRLARITGAKMISHLVGIVGKNIVLYFLNTIDIVF